MDYSGCRNLPCNRHTCAVSAGSDEFIRPTTVHWRSVARRAPYAGETPVRTRKAAAHQAAHHKKKKKSFASKMREKEKQLKGLLGSKQKNPQVGR